MAYISPKNEYPRHIGDIKIENPDWKPGDSLPKGWVEVQEVSPPALETNKIVYEDFPIEDNGVMKQNWQIRDMTSEEIERVNAPITAKKKLEELGFTPQEIEAIKADLVS